MPSLAATLKTLEYVSTLSIVLVAAILLWQHRASVRPTAQLTIPQLPAGPISLETAPVLGDRGATSAMIVFSDFQCPYCGRFFKDTWPRIRDEYVQSGSLLVAFRNLPLPMHPLAFQAAESALCAGRHTRWRRCARLGRRGL